MWRAHGLFGATADAGFGLRKHSTSAENQKFDPCPGEQLESNATGTTTTCQYEI
jgi:hypothetical protein